MHTNINKPIYHNTFPFDLIYHANFLFTNVCSSFHTGNPRGYRRASRQRAREDQTREVEKEEAKIELVVTLEAQVGRPRQEGVEATEIARVQGMQGMREGRANREDGDREQMQINGGTLGHRPAESFNCDGRAILRRKTQRRSGARCLCDHIGRRTGKQASYPFQRRDSTWRGMLTLIHFRPGFVRTYFFIPSFSFLPVVCRSSRFAPHRRKSFRLAQDCAPTGANNTAACTRVRRWNRRSRTQSSTKNLSAWNSMTGTVAESPWTISDCCSPTILLLVRSDCCDENSWGMEAFVGVDNFMEDLVDDNPFVTCGMVIFLCLCTKV